MQEEKNYPFFGHAALNEDVYRDCLGAFRRSYVPARMLWIFITVCMAALIPLFGIRMARIGFMFLAVTALGGALYLHHRMHSGKAYAKFIRAFDGVVPTVYTGFDEDGIHIRHDESGGEMVMFYSSVRRILETDSTLVLILDRNQFHPVRKYSIRGGTPLELCAYIADRANLKKKAPSKEKISNVVSIACILVISLGIGCAMHMEYSQPVLNPAPVESFSQAALELEDLGFRGITPQLLEEAETQALYWAEYGFNPDYRLDLLCLLGYGEYDKTTWEWTPPSSGVFWFDSEAIDVAAMYTQLLQGIQSLDPDALRFTDIQEDLTHVDMENGKGHRRVTFRWMDKQYSFQAKENYDWIDTDAVDSLARKIARAGTGKRLYFAWDGGQGFLVFYADRQWADRFQETTGILLKETIRQLHPVY